MSSDGYLFLGLTALVAGFVAALVFAVFRFMSAARSARQQLGSRSETVLLSSALHDAVSSLKAQERAMSARAAASEELSAQVFDSLTAGLLVVDAAGAVTTVNPAGRSMLGIDVDPVGIGFREVLQRAPALVEVIAEGLSTGRAIVRRSIQVDGDPAPHHLGVTVSPFGGSTSRRGAICLFSDLTQIFELEQQLQTKAALAALGEMTAGLAHEFRNGLATIHGYSRLMDPDRLPEQYRPYIQGIRQETDALGRVVTNFLGFARPETIVLAPVDLAAVVRRAADDLRVDLPASVSVEVSGTFGAIAGDDILLRQTIANLLRNAVEACHERPAAVVAVRGSIDADRRMALVVVEDDGPGIPEEHRARIFQPFFTTRSRGSGLGLSIVQKIVLLHNGRISVGTSAASGARIELAFPLSGD